jgi:hypothetical protein
MAKFVGWKVPMVDKSLLGSLLTQLVAPNNHQNTRVEMIKILMGTGYKNIDANNRYCTTALDLVVLGDSVLLAETLLQFDSKNLDKMDLIDCVLYAKSGLMVELLVKNGAGLEFCPYPRTLLDSIHSGGYYEAAMTVAALQGFEYYFFDKNEGVEYNLSEDKVLEIRYRVYFGRSLCNLLVNQITDNQ